MGRRGDRPQSGAEERGEEGAGLVEGGAEGACADAVADEVEQVAVLASSGPDGARGGSSAGTRPRGIRED